MLPYVIRASSANPWSRQAFWQDTAGLVLYVHMFIDGLRTDVFVYSSADSKFFLDAPHLVMGIALTRGFQARTYMYILNLPRTSWCLLLLHAICHILKPAHLGSGRWSETFVHAVAYYLDERVERAGNWPDDWRCDTVVQSLKTLRRESNADFVRLKEDIDEELGHWPVGYLDLLNMVFDYTCID